MITILIGVLLFALGYYVGQGKATADHIKTLYRYDATLNKTILALNLCNKYLGVLVEDWEEFEKESENVPAVDDKKEQ